MFSHYLKIAFRNLLKDRVYSAINLLSLSLAIACAIALSLYASNQLSYDKYHKNHDSIVRVVNEITTNGQANRYALTSRALGPLLTKEYPQIGDYARVRNFAITRAVFRYQDTAKYWDNVKIADENIFDVFSHEAVYGDLKGALSDPSWIAVSESFAKSYFGDKNPVGETISTDTYGYRISAVFKDMPKNSHLRYDAVLSMKRLRDFGLDDTTSSPEQLFDIENYTYFRLKPGMDKKSFDQLLAKFGDDSTSQVGKRMHSQINFISQALTDIHFDDSYRYDQPVGNILYIYGFIAVALFLVIVACINYTNLATARAIGRSKEIGMRRVIGATKQQLIAQFLGESVCLSLIAAVIGISMLFIINMTVGLDTLLGSNVELNISQQPVTILWILLGAIIIGIAAGLYPALYLSSISTLAAIYNQRNMRRSSFSIREALVFIQLFVSVGIVASTLIMSLQLEYIASKPLGFERDNKLAIMIRGIDAIEKIPVMKSELENQPNIVNVTESSFVPGDEVAASLIKVETSDGNMQEMTVNQISVDRDFVKNVGIEVLAGRDFSKRMLTDVGASVLVNESFVRLMGWTDAVGKRVQIDSHVIGVVKDFHFSSLHSKVGPMMIRQFQKSDLENIPLNQRNLITRSIIVGIKGDNMTQTLETVKRVVSNFDPKHPFEYAFFDDLLKQQYVNEANIMRLTGSFALVCIIISCLGLFGLAAFTTQQRTKEIGVRKVLGATPINIVWMLTKGLLGWVFAAACVASLTTYLVMNYWLQTFAYKTDIHIWIFFAATSLIAILAFFSVAIQAGKTALQNPVNALRYE
ncbi:FtsX-like permease family protein [Undibacterium sp. TJN19]|uniref:FtsX-like permease family protein n=1 Tax=Undibacterium sp. TJN19 TaxID=3413055 RepID=UPI003BEFA4DA